MARRFGFYRVNRGDNLGDPEFWNRRFEDVDIRVDALDQSSQRVDTALDEVVAEGLNRLNNVITPLVVQAQEQIASVPSIFGATSASSVAVGLGDKTFILEEQDRAVFVAAPYLLVQKVGDPSVFMAGGLVSLDRETGALHISVESTGGTGTHNAWTIGIGSKPGATGATGAVGLTARGAYSGATPYAGRDVVRDQGSAWIAKIATTGNAPPVLPTTSNTWWELLVEKGETPEVEDALETAVAALVGSAPGTLDTLQELAGALGDDPNFATTIAGQIAEKAPSSRSVSAGGIATGGGDLSADRTITVTKATGGDWRSKSNGNRALTSDIWTDAEPVDLGDKTGTVALDLATFLNAKARLTGNITLGATSNVKKGQAGVFEFLQDGTGSRTLAVNSTYWVTPGGAGLTLSTAANARDLVVYQVLDSGKVFISLAKDVK